jgi:hypothetical protein
MRVGVVALRTGTQKAKGKEKMNQGGDDKMWTLQVQCTDELPDYPPQGEVEGWKERRERAKKAVDGGSDNCNGKGNEVGEKKKGKGGKESEVGARDNDSRGEAGKEESGGSESEGGEDVTEDVVVMARRLSRKALEWMDLTDMTEDRSRGRAGRRGASR